MSKLYFIQSPMNGSKSALLLMKAHSFEERGIPFICMKPSIDNREGVDFIYSRIGIKRECITIDPDDNIFNIVKNEPDKLVAYYSREIKEYYKDPISHYEIIRDRFNQNHNGFDFCLLSRTCYSGVIRFRKADGYMSTPRGPHKPISPDTFRRRVQLWTELIQKADFSAASFDEAMSKPQKGDVVYCDPPYTHSQGIIYGAQNFNITDLWDKIAECKERGAYVMLSINGTRESQAKDISVQIPDGLFVRELLVNCGTSMIDRLQNSGREMENEIVHDKLLLTW